VRRRYPENTPGPFYVERDRCIICLAPEREAPDLMGFAEGTAGRSSESHCFFRKQPRTPDEIDRAVAALRVACCVALRYAGRDPEVLARLRELGLADQCDHPLEP
jgi:hypothetical protein